MWLKIHETTFMYFKPYALDKNTVWSIKNTTGENRFFSGPTLRI